MADTPKTPTPPRRKASTTPRKSTRSTPPKAPSAAKPATTAATKPPVKRATKAPARKPAAPKSTATKAKAAVKSTATKVGTTASSVKQSVAQSSPAQLVSETRDMMGDRNFFAALIGGAAAIGAAIGGIFYALRDGNPEGPAGKKKRGPKA